MALQSYSVSYSTDGINYTALTNVQNINLNIGIFAQLDQIRASTASVVIRYPTGYASPITALKSGTYLSVKNNTVPASAYDLWLGKIADVTVQYGIPYAGGVGQADFLSITAEGFFADLGRMNGNSYAMSAGTLPAQMTAATGQTGLSIAWLGSVTRTGAATTVSGTWADWVARTALSNNARLWDGLSTGANDVAIVSPFNSAVTEYNFSDTPTGNDQIYDQINFDSLSDNYYTQVTVSTESFGSSTVTDAGATVPYRTYEVNTINASTGQATDFANYLLSNYKTPRLAISSISAIAEAQSSFKLDKLVTGSTIANYPGQTISVTFRGTTYVCIIEGVTMSATPAGTRFTFSLSGADLNAYLILGNTTFGRLDYNKLGY